MDSERKVPEDGTLAWVTAVPSNPEIVKSNIMIIKVPEHLKSPSDPIFHLTTVDRSLPGDDLSGNNILDKLYPGLPKVTLFEEPKPKEDTPSPKKYVQRQGFVRPRRAGSNARGKSRPYYYKKPSPERSNRIADKISPWLPGNEPYIPHINRSMTRIPLIPKGGPRMDYREVGNRPVNDNFVPHRENHTLPQEYPHNPGSFSDGPPSNYSGGFDDGPPPNYAGGFDDGPPPNYAGGFDDGPPSNYAGGFDEGPPPNYPGGFGDGPLPNYSNGFGDGPLPPSKYPSKTGLLPLPKYNNSERRSFRRCNPNSRGGHPVNNGYQEAPIDTGMDYRNLNPRDDASLNQRFQRKANVRKNNYSNQGRAQRRTFQNGERNSSTQRWVTKEMQGPDIRNKDGGEMYGTGKRRAIYRNTQKPFNRRGRNYR